MFSRATSTAAAHGPADEQSRPLAIFGAAGQPTSRTPSRQLVRKVGAVSEALRLFPRSRAVPRPGSLLPSNYAIRNADASLMAAKIAEYW